MPNNKTKIQMDTKVFAPTNEELFDDNKKGIKRKIETGNDKDLYENNKEEVTGETRLLVETLTEALKNKDEKKTSGTWKDIISKANDALQTSDKAAQLSQKALNLYDKLKDLF